ncbi:MAG: hypothetical protein ABWX85_00415 [Arthrobacter sp.]
MRNSSIVADRKTLSIHLADDPQSALCFVGFDGRRIWTFRTDHGTWDATSGCLVIDWPEALGARLSGYTSLSVSVRSDPSSDPFLEAQADVHFDSSAEPLRLVDPASGADLVVNKWGRLAKSFEAKTDEFMSRVLDSAQDLVSVIKSRMDIDLFITGGTLLGPVRDGRIMPNDDDADLAYLSGHENPSDVALESYEMERVLLSEGFELVRHSSGHLQIMFPGSSLSDDYYIDIFSYFVCSGWFYGTFHAREPASNVTIYPLKSIKVNGTLLPGPAEPEQLLAAIYGTGWRTPDPAFKFVTPPAAGRRYYWWLNHFDAHREDWEDHHRSVISGTTVRQHSNFAEWVASKVERNSSIIEVGCGLGDDARYYSRKGHQVLAMDYSRPAIAHSQSTPQAADKSPTFQVTNAYSYRDAAALVRNSRQLPGPINIVAKDLLHGLHPLGRDVVLFTSKHVLRFGGKAYFRVLISAPRPPGVNPDLLPGDRTFDRDSFEQRISVHGLQVESVSESVDPFSLDRNLDYTIGIR